MNATKRPVSIWILSGLYIAVGIIAFTYYFPELMAHQDDVVWIELTELLAIVSGAFMFRGHNWARWLALVWMAFHVAISFPVYRQMAIHMAIFAGIAWVLFRPDARRYFAILASEDRELKSVLAREKNPKYLGQNETNSEIQRRLFLKFGQMTTIARADRRTCGSSDARSRPRVSL